MVKTSFPVDSHKYSWPGNERIGAQGLVVESSFDYVRCGDDDRRVNINVIDFNWHGKDKKRHVDTNQMKCAPYEEIVRARNDNIVYYLRQMCLIKI